MHIHAQSCHNNSTVQPRLSGPDSRFSGVASVLLWVWSQIAMHMDSADLPWAFLNTAGHGHTV